MDSATIQSGNQLQYSKYKTVNIRTGVPRNYTLTIRYGPSHGILSMFVKMLACNYAVDESIIMFYMYFIFLICYFLSDVDTTFKLLSFFTMLQFTKC